MFIMWPNMPIRGKNETEYQKNLDWSKGILLLWVYSLKLRPLGRK